MVAKGYFLTCKLLQGSKILSDCKNNIITQSTGGNIILACRLKTHNGWIASVKFLQETGHERSHLTKSLIQKKDINILDAELGHPSKVITYATGRAMKLHLTGMFSLCEYYALGKARKGNISKKTAERLKSFGERLFFDISSPSTPTIGGKKHWLLVMKDSIDYAWSYFSIEKCDVGLNLKF